MGRLPVRTAGELKTQIGKIISFEERQRDPAWFRAVLWTGASGMNRTMERIPAPDLRPAPAMAGCVRVERR